jgi:hypothetical protein
LGDEDTGDRERRLDAASGAEDGREGEGDERREPEDGLSTALRCGACLDPEWPFASLNDSGRAICFLVLAPHVVFCLLGLIASLVMHLGVFI